MRWPERSSERWSLCSSGSTKATSATIENAMATGHAPTRSWLASRTRLVEPTVMQVTASARPLQASS